ncbi:MAG: FecR family protein [Gammaproteobacteria bacterium]
MSTEDTISEAATQWFLRLREGLSEAEQRRFAEWRAMSPEHARAYAKVERLWAEMAAVARASPALRAASSEPAAIPMTPPRRALRSAGYALAASVMLAVAAILVSRAHLLDPWVSDHYTASGEQREVRLPDGSRALLNTDTAIGLSFTAAVRRVHLQRGQARFIVAVDTARPFEVEAGALRVRALGTVFEVYLRENGEIRVTVEQHAVSVRTAAAAAEVRILRREWLRYLPSQTLGRPEAVDLRETTAWQRSLLRFNDRPLPEVLAELDRYRPGALRIVNPTLKALRVTGVFPLDDPEAILSDIKKALGLRSTKVSRWLVLVHR